MKQLLSPEKFSVDDSSFLDMDYFVRTISGIRAKGGRPDLVGSLITHYASKWLPDLSPSAQPSIPPNNSCRPVPSARHDSPESIIATWTRKRLCVEVLVGMLPPERGSITCDFLLRLLRVGNMVGAEPACRAELERRITRQLEQASLKELLIPSFSHTCGTLLDVELVLRLAKGFVNLDEAVPVRSGAALAKVAKLIDCYLAEAAAIDSNLSSSEFLALARALPDHARSTNDGLYRATDTYLKAHPGLSKQERKTLCRIINSHKLSHEAGLHAIQNDRLPVREVIRIIFSEQTKLHRPLDWSGSFNGTRSPSYLNLEQTVRCQSKREITQQTEMKKLREDLVRLETRCATMQGQIERMLDKKGHSKWKKIGMAALKSVSGGGERSETDCGFGGRTPGVIGKSKSVKGRTPNRWRRSIS